MTDMIENGAGQQNTAPAAPDKNQSKKKSNQ